MKIKITTIFISLIFSLGCNQNYQDSNKQYENSNQEIVDKDSIEGTYSYEDNTVVLSITISGKSWFGETLIISGLGRDYDNENIQFDNGLVRGNTLYDESGLSKIGIVSGKSISTSIGGKYVTLRKK